MTNEIIEFYREHLKPIIQKMLLETNYQGQGKVDYEEFGRDFDELLDLAIIGMQSNSDEDCISRNTVLTLINDVKNANGFSEYSQYEYLFDQVDAMPSVTPKPKTGYCKECKYFEYDSVLAEVDGIPLLVHNICKKWSNGCKTREDGYCFLFEPRESEDKE